MFTRISNSWQLVKASAAVLRADKELIIFPIVSMIGVLIVTATFAAPPFVWPSKALEKSLKKSAIPVSERKVAKIIKVKMKTTTAPSGTPNIPWVDKKLTSAISERE